LLKPMPSGLSGFGPNFARHDLCRFVLNIQSPSPIHLCENPSGTPQPTQLQQSAAVE